MIFETCILAIALILAAIIIANTIENVAKDFFARWDALEFED